MEEKASIIFLIVATVVAVANPQKVPPGVNPNTYQQQQQPPPQQQVCNLKLIRYKPNVVVGIVGEF